MHTSGTALLLIDVINALDFPEGKKMLPHALRAARAVVRLKARAKAEGIPVIYANDNFGIWKSDFRSVVEHCQRDDVLGAPLAKMLAPEEDDYFVLKARHSGFYSTTLELLLQHLGARTLILAGFAGNICVLFTANDAYMRHYTLYVPRDCCASNTAAENRHALEQMRSVLKADIRTGSRLDLAALAKAESAPPPGQ